MSTSTTTKGMPVVNFKGKTYRLLRHLNFGEVLRVMEFTKFAEDAKAGKYTNKVSASFELTKQEQQHNTEMMIFARDILRELLGLNSVDLFGLSVAEALRLYEQTCNASLNNGALAQPADL